ncbi:MAG: c-type cytochrome domain-containing protein [Terracidiphilus sp.]
MNRLQRFGAFVGPFIPKSRKMRAAWLAALVTSVVLLLLPFVVKLDGKPHAEWEQFLGRFHVLAIHLPIGLLLLVPLLEIAGAFRPALREAAGFVLALAFAACLGTLTLGFLLAYGGGETGVTVTRHMWGGVALTIAVLLCLMIRSSWLSGTTPRVYPALLGCALLALVWTGHQGGSMTHGSNYLTRYMPASLERVLTLGIVRAAPAADSFYAQHIDPIFDSNCVSCHGASKTEGGLRLDSYGGLMRGGKDGGVIVAGKPDRSLLLQRVTLPAGDKHLMPAEGKPPLRPQEIAWLRAWVQQGASSSATALAGISLPDVAKDLPLQPVGDYSALMPEIRAMQMSQGAKLTPISSKPSDGLVLNTVDIASTFGDAQLAQFAKFAPYIVEAELGRTAVTDASFDTLSKFTHLRALHLEGTAVAGAGLQKLAPLSQLTYLNLSGTNVTSAAIAPLQSIKNLRHVYLFNTPAQPAPAADAAQSIARSTQ